MLTPAGSAHFPGQRVRCQGCSVVWSAGLFQPFMDKGTSRSSVEGLAVLVILFTTGPIHWVGQTITADVGLGLVEVVAGAVGGIHFALLS